MTVAKLRRGRRIKGEHGRYAYGAPPYGWQAHKKELTPEQLEQAGRARARQLRDEDELSHREIATVLDAERLRPKRGERWHPETVRRMLANITDRPPTLWKRAAQAGEEEHPCQIVRSDSPFRRDVPDGRGRNWMGRLLELTRSELVAQQLLRPENPSVLKQELLVSGGSARLRAHRE